MKLHLQRKNHRKKRFLFVSWCSVHDSRTTHFMYSDTSMSSESSIWIGENERVNSSFGIFLLVEVNDWYLTVLLKWNISLLSSGCKCSHVQLAKMLEMYNLKHYSSHSRNLLEEILCFFFADQTELLTLASSVSRITSMCGGSSPVKLIW